MPENNFDFYWDEYVYFTFNNVHSSQYNLYIQNNVDDLKLIVNDGAKIDFTSPKYAQGQYVLGVTRPQRRLPFKLVAHSLTRRQIAQMHKWLQVGSMASLWFDFAPDWCYDVVVSTLSDFNLYPQDEDNGLFIVSFSIEWVTTTKACARNKFSVMGYYGTHHSGENIIDNNQYNEAAAVTNSLGIPAFTIEEDTSTNETIIRVHHLGDKNTTFRIDHYYPIVQNENKQNTYANKIKLSIRNTDDILPFITSFAGELNDGEGQILGEHLVSYSSEGNMFFADGAIPQKLDLQGHYKDKSLQIDYAHQPLVLSSSGAPIEITQEDLDFLPFIPHPWFVCAVGLTEEQTINKYAESTNNNVIDSSMSFIQILDLVTLEMNKIAQLFDNMSENNIISVAELNEIIDTINNYLSNIINDNRIEQFQSSLDKIDINTQSEDIINLMNEFYSIKKSFVGASGLYSGNGFVYAVKYDTDIKPLDISRIQNPRYYLGYYDTVIIKDDSRYNDNSNHFAGTIQLTSYTEVI